MSEEAGRPPQEPMSVPPQSQATKTPAPKPKSVVLRVFGWSVLLVVGLILLLAVGATWYTGTADFQRRVGAEVVSTLETATGGRVELRHISFSLWHLAIEADGLVIHGTEEPGQMPYLSASKIFLRLHLNVLLTHIRGLGPQTRISLRYLRVEQPRVHLIVYKDGHTNQPTPKHRSPSNVSMEDTLLDLQARKVELADGLAVLNDRAIPFNLAAKDVNAAVHWVRRTDRYEATIDLADLQTKMVARPVVESRMHVAAELGRDMMAVTQLEFWSGAEAGTSSAHLVAQASLQNFAHPQWEGSAAGSVGLKQLGDLVDVDGLVAGTIDVNLKGHNCVAQAAAAPQPRGRFWQRRGKKPVPAPAAKTPDASCTPTSGSQGYVIAGSMKMHQVGYRDVNVRVRDVDGGALVHITPTELQVSEISAVLPGGGGAKGDLRIENWLGGGVPAAAAATSATSMAAATTANSTAQSIGARKPVKPLVTVQPAAKGSHAYLTATVDHIPLRTVMDIVAVENYGDLGFDTSITGPATVEWGDPSSPTVADTVQVQSHLMFAPVGMKRRGVQSNVPLTGEVEGHYDGRLEVVNIAHLALQSPASSLVTSGVLGVNLGDPLTNLQVNLQTRDLGEFDQLLHTLAFEANGKKGAAAIPLLLHGNANFVGTTKGAIRDLDVKGHVTASDLTLQASDFGRSVPDVHIDSVVGSADYSPNGGVSVVTSTIKRGTAVLNLTGTFKPQRTMVHGAATYVWDRDLAIDASAKLADAQATDLLEMAGVQQKVPVTGTVNLDLSASGTVHNIIGGGMVTLTNGVAYGENYQKIAVDVAAEGQQVSLTKVLVEAHGVSITGSAGYNLTTKQMRGQVAGKNLQLSKFDTMRRVEPDADGVLSFTAIANGTLQQPDLHARVTLDKISVQGKQLGGLELKADSTGSNLAYELQSTMVGAQLQASGQTSLVGDFQTQAKLTVTGLDLANVIELTAPGSFKGSSSIAGTVSVSGPAKTPKKMQGSAEFNNVDLKLQGIELKAAQPMRASLKDGMVTLDQIHVTGQDTDLRAAGTAVVFGDPDPRGGRIDLSANGSVSMALASILQSGSDHVGQGDVQGGGGRADEEAGADGQCAVPECESRDGGHCERAEQSEWDAGVQRRPPGREEHDGDDGRRAAEDWRLPGLSARVVRGPYGDRRCGAGALQRAERDGECEPAAAGTTAGAAALGERAGDAVRGGGGCGLCGAVVGGRGAGAAGSELGDEQNSTGRAHYELAAAGLSELVCEAGGLGEFDRGWNAGGAERAGTDPDYGWQRDVPGDQV